MPIVRSGLKHESSFTQIPNDWLRDNRLSLKTIGLLAQLLSHSEGWVISIESLAKHNNCGRDLIRSAISELEQFGYLRREQRRIGGMFKESIYYTSSPSSPSLGFPSSDKPAAGNHTPKNNNLKKNKEKEVIDDFFNQFWEAYPRKVGKAAAKKAFEKLVDAQALAVAGARRLAHDPNLPPEQFIPHPTTWLNREGWLDDPLPERQPTEDEARDAALKLSAARRESEAARSREFITEMNKQAEKAAPIPLCEHGNKLVFCLKCIRKGANDG